MRRLLLLGGLCLLVAAVYSRALWGYFLGDDFGPLFHLAHWSCQGRLLPELLKEFTSSLLESGAPSYRPLFVVSLAVDYLLWGKRAPGWVLTSILVHLGNTVLLWLLVERLARGAGAARPLGVAAAAAVLFALRPSAPEVVAWPSSRGTEMALLGCLVALLAYLEANARPGGWFLVALGGFLFALGSKETAVTLPGGLVALHLAGAIDVERRRGQGFLLAWGRCAVSGVAPFATMLVLYLGWRAVLFGGPFAAYLHPTPVDFADPAWRAVKLHALRFFLAPSMDWSPLTRCVLVVAGAQVLVGLVVAWGSCRARRLWSFGALWLIATLVPLVPLVSVSPAGEGARRFYVPAAALGIVLAAPLGALPERWPWRGGRARYLPIAGAFGVAVLAVASLPALLALLAPWVEAGRSMKAVPGSVAARARAVPDGRLAVLLIPDHLGGAIFGRNGQGALMEPPVQVRSLRDRVLVVTPPTLREHAPRLERALGQAALEHWCWNVGERRFERLQVAEHEPEAWAPAWVAAMRDSGCASALAGELELLNRAPASGGGAARSPARASRP